MQTVLIDLSIGLAFVALALLIITAAKLINDFLTPYLIDLELAKKDNVALAVSFSGYLLGVVIVFIGAYLGPSKGLVADLLYVGGWSLFGVVLLNLSRMINDRLILYKFSNVKEIIEDKNVGTGAVQAGSYIASGFVVAGAINGQGGGLLTALAFFFAGQVVLVLFGFIYQFFTRYDIHAEIEDDNIAAGIAFCGALIAIGIVLGHASAGEFINWSANMTTFASEAAIVVILIPLVRLCFDKITFSKVDLNHEISVDRNVGAAILEASAMIAFASILVHIFG
jgi:uncharacterized membrane protein YjfL (UPF0719 family)